MFFKCKKKNCTNILLNGAWALLSPPPKAMHSRPFTVSKWKMCEFVSNCCQMQLDHVSVMKRRDENTRHTEVAQQHRQSTYLRVFRAQPAVERAPPGSKHDNCSQVTAAVIHKCFNTIKTYHYLTEDSHRFCSGQLQQAFQKHYDIVLFKFVAWKGKIVRIFQWITLVQMFSAAAPVQVPKRGAPSVCRENKVWYLHPILATFSKALRFILL